VRRPPKNPRQTATPVRPALDIALGFAMAFTAACQTTDPCAGVDDLSQSPDGLSLTREEHGVGWAQRECFTCHQVATIHQADCIGDVDMAEVVTAADPEDPTSCVACHGGNGVSWPALDTGQAQ
jgi:hypothetical protein